MSKKYAPVLIGTLNRHGHFKRCVESLSQCPEAIDTDLFIALDYPPSEKYRNGFESISEYIKNGIKGFKTVNVIKREVNFGARQNFMEAWASIFEKFDRVIITEDDNEFSIDFLNFINTGLEAFKDRSDILSVCGYMYPMNFKRDPGQFFLYQGFSAWGFGTWREKFEKITYNIEEINNCITKIECSRLITSKLVKSHLKQIQRSGIVTNDTFVCFYQYMNSMSSLFPKVSRVRNHGHDGTGLHSGSLPKINIYTNQIIFRERIYYSLDPGMKNDFRTNEDIDSYLKFRHINFYLKNPGYIIKKIFGKIKKCFTG